MEPRLASHWIFSYLFLLKIDEEKKKKFNNVDVVVFEERLGLVNIKVGSSEMNLLKAFGVTVELKPLLSTCSLNVSSIH